MVALGGYWWFVGVVRIALLYLAVAVAAICVVDWAVRTRRLSPFGGVARFFRASIDPLMAPVERVLVRLGGHPSAAPWWTLIALAVAGILLLSLLDFAGGIAVQVAAAAASPRMLPMLLLSWAFGLMKLALLVRVISSWLPVSPHSPWIRWSYSLTEWMLSPLRRLVPLVGVMDITPIIAWLLLSLVQRLFGIP